MRLLSGDSKCITSVTIVDVERGNLLPDRTVLVDGDRIKRIRRDGESGVPERSLAIDGHGLYLMPGLVDAHMHFVDPPTFGRMMVAHGVTLVRDMGNPTNQALALRSGLQKGEILGPEMVTTGSPLDGFPPSIPQVAIACRMPEEGRDAVRKQAASGVNQIKVYSGLERDVFLAIADEAQGLGLKVVGHVPEAVYIEEAAERGQRSCEHLFGFGKMIARLLGEPVRLKSGGMGTDVQYFARLSEVDSSEMQKSLNGIRSHGMAVCPTMVVFKHATHLKDILAGSHPMAEYVSPMVRDMWNSIWGHSQQDSTEGVLRNMQAFVKILHEADFTMMVGTDLLVPGVIPGYSVHEEMALWQEAGVPPTDVLRDTTIVPARFVGLDHRLGTIAEGKTASMVLVRDNPLEDVRNAGKIEGVFLRGRFFNRDELDRLMQETMILCRS